MFLALWAWFVLSYPYEFLFAWTVPPARGKFRYQFMATFFICLGYLAVISYVTVTCTEKLGCILEIDDDIMGVTFLAVGTSDIRYYTLVVN